MLKPTLAKCNLSRSIKRVLLGTERGLLIWDPRTASSEKKTDKLQLIGLVCSDNSIRTMSVTNEFRPRRQVDSVFIGDDKGCLQLIGKFE